MLGGAGFLPSTVAPENGWLEYYLPFRAQPIFRGKMLGFREYIIFKQHPVNL